MINVHGKSKILNIFGKEKFITDIWCAKLYIQVIKSIYKSTLI